MHASQLLLTLAAAGLVSAQNTVTSMFMYGADPQPLVASIVGSVSTSVNYNYANLKHNLTSLGCHRNNLQHQLFPRHG
jgi:hypothetical protein